ncbi:MAG: pilus assembly protein [Chloroflexi bacterium]|nr:pilus assembly protein [Chloroflexota bacterium]
MAQPQRVRRPKTAGQALVEFGLILPVLLLVITGIIDFGQVAVTYVQSLSALRNAARFAEVAGFATIPGQPTRYLDCEGMIDAANDILFADNQTLTITYHKANDYGNTSFDCDTVSADLLVNGDILEIVSSARIQFITPFVSGLVPDLNIAFTARRTIIKSLELGSDDITDTDYDGLDDAWEISWFGDLSAIATGDPDGDGCNNGCEEARGTNPIDLQDTDGDGLDDAEEAYLYNTDGTDVDTDDDGLTDYEEVITYGTNPLVVDTDGDTLSDGDEVNVYGTDPNNPDTDGDGIFDAEEVGLGSDPNLADTDSDTLSDYQEVVVHGTSPILADTDGDILSDPVEVAGTYNTSAIDADTDNDVLLDGEEVNTYFTRPDAYDTDGDNLSDYEEVLRVTNPNDIDTDDDNLTDGDEVNLYGSDPLNPDTDGDGVNDGDEIVCGTSPVLVSTFPPALDSEMCNGGGSIDPDSDDDGLPDIWEISTFGHLGFGPLDDPDGDGINNQDERLFGTNGNNPDTDGDGRTDGEEQYGIGGPTSNPKIYDTDGDGLSDGQEVNVYGTNPNLQDSDGDGLLDPAEILIHGTNPNDPDSDDDGLNDSVELTLGTLPMDADTDDDGLNDGEEVNLRGTNPLMADTDSDGLSDFVEIYETLTVPTDSDTDDDQLNDGSEVNLYGTDPNKADTDGDTLTDWAEMFAFPLNPLKTTDPLVQDTDLDGKRDDFELNNGTLPNNPIGISVLAASVTQDRRHNKSVSMIVTLKLDKPSVETTRIRYRTADGTPPGAATLADNDYEQIVGTEMVFLPGVTTRTFVVTIGGQSNGFGGDIGNETFFIMLNTNDNGYIKVGQATMTILYNR